MCEVCYTRSKAPVEVGVFSFTLHLEKLFNFNCVGKIEADIVKQRYFMSKVCIGVLL